MRDIGKFVWVVVIAAVVAACSSPRSNVRLGSLAATQRSLDYDPGIVSWKLGNQLTVAMMPDTRVNLVSVEVRYLVGAADDPPGKTGLAHLVEHVMFARRTAAAGPEVADRLSAVALRFNAWTSWDATHYDATALASQLDDLLAIEAARMAGGCDGIDDSVVARERAVVLEELAQRDGAGVREPLQQAVFGDGHAYSHSVGGRDVAALTRDDVCSFLDAHYAPSRAILVVSGLIPGTAVHAISTRFGSIAPRATGKRAVVQPIAWSEQVRDLSLPVDDPHVLVMFPAAPWGSPEWIYDNLVERIALQRIWQAARRQPWILDVALQELGGERGGARGFTFRLTDAAHADDAVADVFTALHNLPSRGDGDLVFALANARQNDLLDAFASIDTRGRWCANFLQFTNDGRFHMRELRELQHIDPVRLRERADRLSRKVSHVVRVVPDHARGRAAWTAGANIDRPVWRAAVDPGEANRPIALPRDARSGAPIERRLANGLRVLLLPDAKQPIFDARLVFPVGAAGTGGGKPGVATAAAGLLSHDYQGWFTPKERQVFDWVVRLGAPVSRLVSDHTTFRVHGFSLFADAHLWRLYWLLTNGRYEGVDVDHMQEVVARDAAHRDRERAGRLALRAALFGRDHPYAQDWLAAIASNAGSLTAAELEQFREAHYRASGATLILVGNFNPDAMMKLVTELFGAWPAEPPPAIAAIPPTRPAPGPISIADIDAEAVQVRVSVGFAATSPRSARAARLILAEMVRDRVEQVRSRLGASYGVDVRYGTGVEGDLLTVGGLVDAGRAGEAVRQIVADLDALRAGDASFAADFVRARRVVLVRALGDPTRSSIAADRLEAVVANHLPSQAVETLPAEVASTTAGAVRAVIAQDLQAARMVLMLSGRQPDVAAGFAAAGVTKFETVSEPPAGR